MEQKSYESVKQFEEDLKWFNHNCRTIHPQNVGIHKASKELIKCVKGEIQYIQACEGCYENLLKNGRSFVSKPCSKPHLLIWGKVKGFSYWPAKVLTFNVDNQTIYVEFFGDYSNCILSVSNCFLYSKDHPEKKVIRQKSHRTAIKVSLNAS